jgi:transposase
MSQEENVMLQIDFSAKLLDMEQIEINNVETTSQNIVVSFKLHRRAHTCPRCGGITDKTHDYRLQVVKDAPALGKHLLWHYAKRRYQCGCCGKRFYESNYLLPKWHRLTNRLAAYCLSQLRRKCSQREIAHDAGVSPSTIGRWLNLLNYSKPQLLPKVLSIDEFRGNTDGNKFQCILTAPKAKAVFDILPTRYGTDLSNYFRSFSNRKEVKYMVMDMNKEYLALARQHFPNAKIVIDRFHVVRYCTWALENVRKRVQKALPAAERKYFKRSRRLLLSRMSKLSDTNKAAVERMLLVSPDLREAYLLKEKFYEFMASPDSATARQRLKAFHVFAVVADIPEFASCLTMLKNWSNYILNAFDFPYSNGFTEGINNTIKVIKRVAYGYRNFSNFRRRILTTLNTKLEPISLH